ncbi:MAG TPA: hypothetical protein VMK12_11435 [Anaeromyxobacteraceae bacterium]|nr:hypothetical protein [Anaeromyxobacteraceae bacterium]
MHGIPSGKSPGRIAAIEASTADRERGTVCAASCPIERVNTPRRQHWGVQSSRRRTQPYS